MLRTDLKPFDDPIDVFVLVSTECHGNKPAEVAACPHALCRLGNRALSAVYLVMQRITFYEDENGRVASLKYSQQTSHWINTRRFF